MYVLLFNDKFKNEDFAFDIIMDGKSYKNILVYNNFDILIDEKSYEKILVYNISYKSLICAKPLRIRFDKVDGFIRAYDGTRHLVLW